MRLLVSFGQLYVAAILSVAWIVRLRSLIKIALNQNLSVLISSQVKLLYRTSFLEHVLIFDNRVTSMKFEVTPLLSPKQLS